MNIQDPRFKNQTFDAQSASAYLKQYAEKLQHTLDHLDDSAVNAAAELLKPVFERGNRVFVAGNGGSAAISDHLCCDWTKGTSIPGQKTMKTQSLVSNVALLTAVANDFGYENCFSRQLEMLSSAGDIVVLISSSGNSPNILLAAETARKLSLKTIGFTGFTGGKLGELVDVHLHAAFDNYGLVEDAHQILMHVLSQFLTAWRENPIRPISGG